MTFVLCDIAILHVIKYFQECVNSSLKKVLDSYMTTDSLKHTGVNYYLCAYQQWALVLKHHDELVIFLLPYYYFISYYYLFQDREKCDRLVKRKAKCFAWRIGPWRWKMWVLCLLFPFFVMHCFTVGYLVACWWQMPVAVFYCWHNYLLIAFEWHTIIECWLSVYFV